jgi:putative tryptophan/tyrosine transport system substrate-binding protein
MPVLSLVWLCAIFGRGRQMRRREFITLLGSATALWPVAANAQQTAMPVIGFLSPATAEAYADRLRGFHHGLKETGYVEGENVVIVYRWAEEGTDLLPELAADLVRRQISVIASFGPAATYAAKAATATIPIAFTVNEDPVRLGLVASVARPGGNATGINFLTAEVAAKRLELLRELAPGATRVGVLINPDNATSTEATLKDVTTAARTIGLQIQLLNARTGQEINAAFDNLVRERSDALLVAGDAFFSSRRVQLVHLATRHAVPATYSQREFADIGGLMSYGPNLTDAYRQVGAYVGRILKGAKPADLPVVQSSKFELVINAETARLLRLTLPASLVAVADEVIE